MLIASDSQAFVSDHAVDHGTGPFVIDLAKQPNYFRQLKNVQFDVSSRLIVPEANILDYLKTYFMYLNQDQIATVFGNVVYPSRLYGGRPYNLMHSITDAHLRQLQAVGIGISLTLTNHFCDSETYDQNLPFLDRFHAQGNTIVCTNDELARRIRQDFPRYKLKASLIKHLNTVRKVEKAFDHYDYVVIPMDKNDDEEFLRVLPEKHRVYLFGNASCAYNCPSRSCYVGISQVNQHLPQTSSCSIPAKPRHDEGHIYFDAAAFQDMGYTKFKMVPNQRSAAGQVLAVLEDQRQKKVQSVVPAAYQPQAVVYSYPKCGRTWLRFMLANYLNAVFKLGVPINFQSIFTLLPNDSESALKGRPNYQFADRAQFPLICFSHQPASESEPDTIPTVLLLRGIPDVVVSDYFHRSRLLASYSGGLSEFIHAADGGLQRYLAYLNHALSGANGTPMLMSYEGLSKNATAELGRMLKYLGLPVHEDALEQAIAQSSFEIMSQLEASFGIPGHKREYYRDPEARRARKGKRNGYRDYLNEDDIEFCRQETKRVLTPSTWQQLKILGQNGILDW